MGAAPGDDQDRQRCSAGAAAATEFGWLDLLRRCTGVVGRSGQAMAGAMCGIFVAAQLTMTNPATFDVPEFVAGMVGSGIVGFYLGIDMPGPALSASRVGRVIGFAKSAGAIGTFLAALAALISIYDFVFEEPPGPVWEVVLAGGWMLGVTMQSAAGLLTRFKRACARGERRTLAR